MENENYEFEKLDEIDLEVAKWLKDKLGNTIHFYLNYLVQSYKERGIFINAQKLIEEFTNIPSNANDHNNNNSLD